MANLQSVMMCRPVRELVDEADGKQRRDDHDLPLSGMPKPCPLGRIPPKEEGSMSANTVAMQGIVKPDGTLELDGKVPLPVGRVQVTVQAVAELPEGDPFFDLLKGIWADQQARGHVPRSVEEVEAERRQFREDWEERLRNIERIQEEARRPRERGR